MGFNFPDLNTEEDAKDSLQTIEEQQEQKPEGLSETDRELSERLKRIQEEELKQKQKQQKEQEMQALNAFKQQELPKLYEESEKETYRELLSEKFESEDNVNRFVDLMSNASKYLGPASQGLWKSFLEKMPDGDAQMNYLFEDEKNMVEFMQPFLDVLEKKNLPFYDDQHSYKSYFEDPDIRYLIDRYFDTELKKYLKKSNKKIFGKDMGKENQNFVTQANYSNQMANESAENSGVGTYSSIQHLSESLGDFRSSI